MNHNDAVDTPIHFTFHRVAGKIVDISTTSSEINHFLQLIALTRSHHTWINYAYDLQCFFQRMQIPLDAVDRHVCTKFLEHQLKQGYADATINRRLAALSSLFAELQALDPQRFQLNPISPARQGYRMRPRGRNQGLYRKQAQRVPDVLSELQLRHFLEHLPSWRDRAVVLLMCFSCLRVSEVTAIQFADVECSQRKIIIPRGKGGWPRTTYMDRYTFFALNQYLDYERKNLFGDQESIFVVLKGRTQGQPLSVNAVQHMVHYYAQQCGLPTLHPHRLRHTGITWLLQGGMPEPVLRTLVGHRSSQSLEPYVHLHDTFIQQEFDRATTGLGLDLPAGLPQ